MWLSQVDFRSLKQPPNAAMGVVFAPKLTQPPVPQPLTFTLTAAYHSGRESHSAQILRRLAPFPASQNFSHLIGQLNNVVSSAPPAWSLPALTSF